jgi:hypothetical protein
MAAVALRPDLVSMREDLVTGRPDSTASDSNVGNP